jgi:hypothetical protein
VVLARVTGLLPRCRLSRKAFLDMTTELGQLAARDSASLVGQHLAAIAASLAEHGITGRVTRLGGTPVLTIDEPAGGELHVQAGKCR